MPQMVDAISACSSTHNAQAIQLETIYDIKGWFDPHIQPMKGHSNPHYFKIKRDLNEKAQILYKVSFFLFL